MARGIVSVIPGRGSAAVKARLPKGDRTLTQRHVAAIDNMSQRISTGKGCLIVFFKKRGGGLVAAQRCEGRKLSTGAGRRWKAMRGKKVCRAKSGSKKGEFIRCR